MGLPMACLELLLTLLAHLSRPDPLRDFLSGEARGQLMLMLSTTPMAMVLLPMLPGLPRVLEARGLLMLKLMLMLTTMEDMDIPMLTVDMDILLHTEDMDMLVLDTVMAVDTTMVKLLCCYTLQC